MKLFRRIKAEIAYRMAVRAANAGYERTGRTHYVMPTESGKLMIVTAKSFSYLRNTKRADKGIRVRNLHRESLYNTDCRSKKGKRIRKEKYLRWLGL